MFGHKKNSDLLGNKSTNLKSSVHEPSHAATNNNNLVIDKNCVGCSGNSGIILKQLKVACLSFVNSEVEYKNKKYSF